MDRTPPKRGHLFHQPPPGIDVAAAVFHIRMRIAPGNTKRLTDQDTAQGILESVVFYARNQRWWPTLFLLMPDHLHAMLYFPQEKQFARVVGDWKRWITNRHGVRWQPNFFDHRIRGDESLDEKELYIRMNPVVKGLCATPEEWPWIINERDVIALLRRQ